jgi:biopolymer transport protein TolR
MARERKSIAQMNVVPYIDVMLVLLVIFMVTAPLINPGQVELPSVGQKLNVPVQPIEVTVLKNGRYTVRDGTTASPVQVLKLDLVDRVRQAQAQRPDRPVVIAADKDARYETVLEVLDLLQRSNVHKVGLLARSPT